MRLSPRRPPRGLTLVELLVSVVILAIVTAGITKVLVDAVRGQAMREEVSRMQRDGRAALQWMAHDLRAASLGAPVGVIISQNAAGNALRRPAVQIFDAIAGGANIPMKPQTDALLVVNAVTNGVETAVRGTWYSSTAEIAVTNLAPLAEGMRLLVGPYKEATWAAVQVKSATGIRLAGTQNLFPSGKAESGSLVREARATLYYVSAADELVEQELFVPRPPVSLAEMGERRVLSRGVENLQLDCELDDGLTLGACGAVMASATPEAAEATWLFGAWGAGGPRLNQGNIANLRTVILSMVVRGQRGLASQRGDELIALPNSGALGPAGADASRTDFARRAYRLPVAVRNTSLGAL